MYIVDYRSPNNILGCSKETTLALVTNRIFEGHQWHRQNVCNQGIKPEHPRASSTDDVECFFSMMRDSIGSNFKVKQVKFGIRKEFVTTNAVMTFNACTHLIINYT